MDSSQVVTIVALVAVTGGLIYSLSSSKLDIRLKRLEQDVGLIMKHLGVQSAAEQALGARGQEIDALLRQGKKITAIKLYREITGTGLKEAKEAVDRMAAGR